MAVQVGGKMAQFLFKIFLLQGQPVTLVIDSDVAFVTTHGGLYVSELKALGK